MMLSKRIIWLLLLLIVFGSSPAHAFFSIQDHVGNTAALTDESETVIDEFHYSPYGTVTYQKNSYETPFRFGGFFGIQTDSNGLVHMRARYYNPLIRRFINSDPARDQWNWFAYAGGNPISYVDPTGFAANLANGGGGGIGSGLLDLGQTGIGIVGLVPAFGNAADLINAGISTARGNYVDAAIDGASALPAAGQVAGGAAIVNRGGRGIGKIVDGVKSLFNRSGASKKLDDVPSGFKGSKGFELKNSPHQSVRNAPGEVGGRQFTGHAFDQMQNRGIMPSVVEDAIQAGTKSPGNLPGTTVHFNQANNISVVTDTASGRVITVRPGNP